MGYWWRLKMKMAPGVRLSVCNCDPHVSLLPRKAAGFTVRVILMLLLLLLLLLLVVVSILSGVAACW
jgi:hypothetical protein